MRRGELLASGAKDGHQWVLRVAGYQEGVVVGKEREEVWEAVFGGGFGVGGGVYRGYAGRRAGEVCI